MPEQVANPASHPATDTPASAEDHRAPEDCRGMEDIRREINRLDDVLVPLLVKRLSYVGRAAAFKPRREDVVVPWRVEEVVARAGERAEQINGDTTSIERIWRALVDASIAFEGQKWDQLNQKS